MSVEFIGIEVNHNEPIPRIIAFRNGHRMSRDEIKKLTDDMRFALMLMTSEDCHDD